MTFTSLGSSYQWKWTQEHTGQEYRIRTRTSPLWCPKDCSDGLGKVSFKTSSLRMTQGNTVRHRLKDKAKGWLVSFNTHSNLKPTETEFWCEKRWARELRMGVRVVLSVCIWESESQSGPSNCSLSCWITHTPPAWLPIAQSSAASLEENEL